MTHLFSKAGFGSFGNKRPETPSSASLVPPYKDAFSRAVAFTTSCGFDIQDHKLSDDNDIEVGNDTLWSAVEAANVTDVSKSAGQCLKWCHYLRPHFEQALQRRVFLTVGQLWKGDRCIFRPTFEDLKCWVDRGIQPDDLLKGDGLQLHAWLTIENGQIIEPTFLSTLATFAHESYKQFAGGIMLGRDPHMIDGHHRYFPMTIGDQIFEHVNSKSSMPLLARNLKDLGSVSVLMVPT